MDVLNKFCSTVSSTVSQLSGVLPGNPVTREYEVTGHIASAGPGLFWKVYGGYKKSTKQPASIFVFEKRQIVPQDKDALVELLKRGISQLTKLRHPQILVVQHPLEESRDCLAFATEPVLASLANILGFKDNMPASNSAVNSYKLFDVEIKYGLLQVGEGLQFLHRDAKILHHNLCPSSIVINEQGAWKIFGFDFAIHNSSVDATPSWKCLPQSSYVHDVVAPNWDYLAPECGLAETISPASDMYSLGMLIFAIYNSGKPLFTNRSWEEYRTNMTKLKTVQSSQFSDVADGLRILVKTMLNFTPELRPEEPDFIKCEFFEDIGVKALNYLDSLFQWDNRQKSHFYKGLPQILDKLPQRVRVHRVVPCLAKEFVNPMMVPFVLPCVFAIAENCSKQEFSSLILPHLKKVMHIQEPIQVLLLFMQNMNLLLKMAPHEEVKADVLPLLYRALESDVVEIQELCLSVLPTIAQMIDYPVMKNSVLPRIKRLCISTSSVAVRVNCLVCVGKLIEHLDKWIVLDDVLPFLPQIPSKEPAVLMGILGIYKLVLNNKRMSMSKDMMAQKVIPFLMPLAVENFLTLNQFNAIISVIKDMVNRVEAEHRVKLEQLHEQRLGNESELSEQLMSGPPLNPTSATPKSTPPLQQTIGRLDFGDSILTNGRTSSVQPLKSSSVQSLKSPSSSESTVASSFATKLDLQVKQFETSPDPLKSNQFGSFQSHSATSPTAFSLSTFPTITPPAQAQNLPAFKSFTGATPAQLQHVGPNMSLNLSQSQSLLGSQPAYSSTMAKPPDRPLWSSHLQAPLLPAASVSNSSSTKPKTLSKDEINDLLS